MHQVALYVTTDYRYTSLKQFSLRRIFCRTIDTLVKTSVSTFCRAINTLVQSSMFVSPTSYRTIYTLVKSNVLIVLLFVGQSIWWPRALHL